MWNVSDCACEHTLLVPYMQCIHFGELRNLMASDDTHERNYSRVMSSLLPPLLLTSLIASIFMARSALLHMS